MNSNGWLIDGYYNKLRILDVVGGSRTSVKIQISTNNSEHYLSILCPDLFVVIRNSDTGKILGAKYVSTSANLLSCLGSSTIFLNDSFKPGDFVDIEVYDDSVSNINDVETGLLKGKIESINILEATAISNPVDDSFYGSQTTDFLGGFGEIFKLGAIFMGLFLVFKITDFFD